MGQINTPPLINFPIPAHRDATTVSAVDQDIQKTANEQATTVLRSRFTESFRLRDTSISQSIDC